MFRKHIPSLKLSFAAAPLFSLCLKHLVLVPVSLSHTPDEAQSTLIGQLVQSVVIGQLHVTGAAFLMERGEEIGLFTISLFTSKAEREYLPEFLKETLNHAVLDCGCVKSVCGRKWLEIYLDSLSKKDASTVQQMSSNAKFRFGASGPLYSSTKRMKFPGYLGKIRVMLEADVIESDIPLLLSKESMKKAATQIDFLTDKVIMLGEQMPIKSLKSGHYAVPLSKFGSIENGIAAIESVFFDH